MDVSNTMTMDVNENTNLGISDYEAASPAQRDAAVKVVSTAPFDGLRDICVQCGEGDIKKEIMASKPFLC